MTMMSATNSYPGTHIRHHNMPIFTNYITEIFLPNKKKKSNFENCVYNEIYLSNTEMYTIKNKTLLSLPHSTKVSTLSTVCFKRLGTIIPLNHALRQEFLTIQGQLAPEKATHREST